MRERSIWTFTACAVLLAIPGLIGVLRLDHLALHMAVNRFHAPWADVLFPYLTAVSYTHLTLPTSDLV